VRELEAFYKRVGKFKLNEIISIDETSIHAQITNNYSRCELGKRCVRKTTNNAVFSKYTLVCAINSKGIVGWDLYEKGGMNSIRMVSFIDKYIFGKYKDNAIIMDNGGSHKSKEIKNKIAESGNFLLYSVPYRPKTNAIESFFSQIKHYFDTENKSITYSNLKTSVKSAVRKIKKEHYKNYMKYAYEKKAKTKFLEKESTRRRKHKIYQK
jgi:transposase